MVCVLRRDLRVSTLTLLLLRHEWMTLGTHTQSWDSGIEGNILIVVACISCFPVVFRHTKTYMASTTSSIRRRFLASRRTPHSAEKDTGTDSAGVVSLAWAHDSELRTGDHFTYIEMSEPPFKSNTASLEQDVRSTTYAVV